MVCRRCRPGGKTRAPPSPPPPALPLSRASSPEMDDEQNCCSTPFQTDPNSHSQHARTVAPFTLITLPQGCTKSLTNLGVMLRNGGGPSAQRRAGCTLFEQGCRFWRPDGSVNLSKMCEAGRENPGHGRQCGANSSRWPLRVGLRQAQCNLRHCTQRAGLPVQGLKLAGTGRRPASGTIWQRGRRRGACVALGRVRGRQGRAFQHEVAIKHFRVAAGACGEFPARRPCDRVTGKSG